MSEPAPPMWRAIKEGEVNCPAMGACLVCDLPSGHEQLHYDAEDHIWWRPGDMTVSDE